MLWWCVPSMCSLKAGSCALSPSIEPSPMDSPLPLMLLIPCAKLGESKARSSGSAFLWLYSITAGELQGAVAWVNPICNIFSCLQRQIIHVGFVCSCPCRVALGHSIPWEWPAGPWSSASLSLNILQRAEGMEPGGNLFYFSAWQDGKGSS